MFGNARGWLSAMSPVVRIMLPGIIGSLGLAGSAGAQQLASRPALEQDAPAISSIAPAPAGGASSTAGFYRLGAGDEISVRALDEEALPDKPIRIDASGCIRLPLVGRLKAKD